MQKTLERDTVFKHFISQLPHFRHLKKVEVGERGYAFSAWLNGKRQPIRGVVLVRSSDYWKYRLHLQKSVIGLVVCYRHDSVVPVPVLALEDGRDYECEDLPGKYGSLDVVRAERSRHAAKVFLGALLCGKKAAHDLLLNMDESTRRKYEARMHRYQRRQPGRPLAV